MLQGGDGIALKENVDAWADASGADKRIRFADAETTSWAQWDLQSYCRLLLGVTFVLFGIAVAVPGSSPDGSDGLPHSADCSP